MQQVLRFSTLCLLAAAVWAAGGMLSGPATAQSGVTDEQGIAALVNDDIVTDYDLEMRLNLILSSTGAINNPQERERLRRQVLRTLIDEKLQLQEAAEHELEIPDEDVQRAFRSFAESNNLTEGQFEDYLISIGSHRETIENQIRADMAWSELVRGRMSIYLNIGDAEVEGVIDRMKRDAGKPEYQISEIFLLVSDPSEEDQVKETADRIVRRLRQGLPFPALARQFSDASSAASGGDVGWVMQGQFAAPELEAAVSTMAPGQVSEPIRAGGGYYILALRDRRRILAADPEQVKLNLSQIIVAFDEEPSDERRIETARRVVEATEDVESCDEIPSVARELNAADFGAVGEVSLSDLAPNVGRMLDSVEVGHASLPMHSPQSVQVFFVCGRSQPEVAAPDFDEVEQRLRQQKMAMFARRYLRDLRQDAIVDIR